MHPRVAVLTAALLIAGASSCSAADAAGPARATTSGLAVTAFQEGSASPALIDRSRRAITTVGVDGVTLSDDGAHAGTPDAATRRQLTTAHRDHLRAELLVSNYSDAIGDFSEPVGHRLLANGAHRIAVVTELARTVRAQHWDGVSVDLESLAARDTAGLTAFVRQLAAALPAGATLSICVQNATTAAGFAALGYDLRALGAAVDRFMLMAYDEHGPWEDTPGPIGSLAWQRAGLAVVARAVPRSKLDLGTVGYGYAWRPHSNDTLTVAQARRLAGPHARFDPRTGEWTATLADGSVLWWADARSYRIRVALARSLHLHGLAVWSLGQADPLTPPQ